MIAIWLLNFFSKKENIIATILISLILILSTYSFILNKQVKNRDNTIIELKLTQKQLESNNKLLSNSINEQNLAIDKMHNEQALSIISFTKKYKELKVSQKPTIKYIEKQSDYVSPNNLNECDASKLVIKDFIKFRDSK